MTTFIEAFKDITDHSENWLESAKNLHHDCWQHKEFQDTLLSLAMDLLLKDILLNRQDPIVQVSARIEAIFLMGMQVGLTMNRSDWEPKL